MIISHKHKFIFLKTEKTAGTSIEIALSKHCGPDDVITPISPEDEEIRQGLGYRGPQNYLAPAWDYGVRDLARLLLRNKRKARFYNHITAREAKAHIDPRIWEGYYKFCFERNPFDRIISHYYWCNQSEPRPTISDFMRSERALDLKHRGFGIYTIDGKMAVDKVCRFERIAEELEAIRLQVEIPQKLDLPHAKSKHRVDKRSYREVLGVDERRKVSEMFQQEIDLFNYEF